MTKDSIEDHGFAAVVKSMNETYGRVLLSGDPKIRARKFVDKLEEKGYCIAKYSE